MTRPLHLTAVAFAAFALVVMAAGCGSDWQNYGEKHVRSGICRPDAKGVPRWVQGQLPKTEDEIYFVGRGVGHNVFDERGAYDAAVNNVMEQMGKQVATWVSAQAGQSDVRTFAPGSGWLMVSGGCEGNRFLPGERSSQKLASAARMCTESLVGELEARDVYWEQWYLEEMPERPLPWSLRMKRYKCWVLMSVPKKAMQARIATTLQALKAAAAGPDMMFAAVGSHVTTNAKELDVIGASRLFKMTSPKAGHMGD